MPSENISDGILSVMLPNTVNNILSRLFQTAFEKQGVSVKYSGLNLNQDNSGLTKIRTRGRSRRQYRQYDKARQRRTGLNLIHYIIAGYGLPP
ncbi:hypothetical protein [Neisseria meningitidis]|uniref:hypothetical protein n=1 Tax=Neisseria meningitidis TaxID=487 RepID=UPI0005E57CCE|nr:hypothetical protein [Neisseria meningitidis]CKJ72133.1 Uncharacterised protein [Neisseria meningitidis]